MNWRAVPVLAISPPAITSEVSPLASAIKSRLAALRSPIAKLPAP
jgi:hypothetical protein